MKHNERVQKIKSFTEKNKIFVIMATIAVIFLFSGFFFSKENDVKTSETIQTENAEETVENPQWQFYWSDLWVLLGVGGFCTVMIIRERKKLKEELQ
ncbi:MAG: hypothetical protein NC177_13305 [Ruminococcus flavefaciens]|nr:hypothetical protein [Ruminococcus flavefaciens]